MNTYDWILFDIDETLLHFDDLSGLTLMFSKLGIEFTKEHYREYQTINKSLWTDYQKGKITLPQLKATRFNSWAIKNQMEIEFLNQAFFAAMTEICKPLEGAISLIQSLKNKSRLGIITNGFSVLQEARLARTGLNTHFEVIVMSEKVGVGKPHAGIFDHALALMGNPTPSKVLMVGDNFDADILGGANAGFDTCWINHHKVKIKKGIKPTYQVSCLAEIETLFNGN
jgi:YjjG family noncanonical pyrimidine nucleotidase